MMDTFVKAQLVDVEPEGMRMKNAAASTKAFMAAKTKGVEMPPAPLAALQGQEEPSGTGVMDRDWSH